MFEKDLDSFHINYSTQSKRNTVSGKKNKMVEETRKYSGFGTVGCVFHVALAGANDAGTVHDNHLGGLGC